MHDAELPESQTPPMTDAELVAAVRRIIKTPEKWPTGSVYPSERLARAIIEFFQGQNIS